MTSYTERWNLIRISHLYIPAVNNIIRELSQTKSDGVSINKSNFQNERIRYALGSVCQ